MSETECTFVSTRGIAKSCVQCPEWKLDGSIYYPLQYNNRYGDTIYLMFDWVEGFIHHHLPHIKEPFVLVTGNSDHTAPNDFPSATRLLESSKCLAWFSQNCVSINHPKLKHIPIGLDYHTLTFPRGDHSWGPSGVVPLLQEMELKRVRSELKSLESTIPRAVTNFHLAMNEPPRRFYYRQPAYQELKNNPSITWLPVQTRVEFWKSCNESAFVICPFGNGLDTHRTWEVLALGRIPVIKSSPLNVIFKKLPVLEIEEWNQLTPEYMESQYQLIVDNYQKGEYDFSRLTLGYWMDKINALRR
jgi:hypothetical protein